MEGTLAIMVGGDPALLERARPVLACMGKNIFHAGPVGAGHAIKLVNNMCSGGILALTIEAVAVAARAGVDPTRAVEILQASSGRSNASDNKFPRFILNGAFDAGFAIRLMMKDLDGYGRLAQEAGVPSPVARAAAGGLPPRDGPRHGRAGPHRDRADHRGVGGRLLRSHTGGTA